MMHGNTKLKFVFLQFQVNDGMLSKTQELGCYESFWFPYLSSVWSRKMILLLSMVISRLSFTIRSYLSCLKSSSAAYCWKNLITAELASIFSRTSRALSPITCLCFPSPWDPSCFLSERPFRPLPEVWTSTQRWRLNQFSGKHDLHEINYAYMFLALIIRPWDTHTNTLDTQSFSNYVIVNILVQCTIVHCTYLYKQACLVPSNAKAGPMQCDTKKMFYMCVCVCGTTDFLKQDEQ